MGVTLGVWLGIADNDIVGVRVIVGVLVTDGVLVNDNDGDGVDDVPWDDDIDIDGVIDMLTDNVGVGVIDGITLNDTDGETDIDGSGISASPRLIITESSTHSSTSFLL